MVKTKFDVEKDGGIFCIFLVNNDYPFKMLYNCRILYFIYKYGKEK